MASYAVIYLNGTAFGLDTLQALVVTDGTKTVVIPTDDPVGLSDVEWPTGDAEQVLRAGLANLYYYDVDGPHTFEGTTDESAAAIAAIYGLN